MQYSLYNLILNDAGKNFPKFFSYAYKCNKVLLIQISVEFVKSDPVMVSMWENEGCIISK